MRADAARNRRTLLMAATRAFASAETEPSMRAIAREAGVGMGTLYRHFPTRELLVDAVYQDDATRLVVGAHDLLEGHPPARALRLWMDLFADWQATKPGMLDTLVEIIGSEEAADTETCRQIVKALTMLLDSGEQYGDICPGLHAEDIAASVAGIIKVTGAPAQSSQTVRLLDLLMQALRPQIARRP